MQNPFIAETRSALASIRDYLTHIEARLDELESAKPQLPSYAEEIAEATSTTAVFKVIERRVGLDRRTLLGKLERLVRAHRLEARFPEWSTDVTLARYVAQLEDDGRPRLLVATEALG
jgi:beta-lactamase class D